MFGGALRPPLGSMAGTQCAFQPFCILDKPDDAVKPDWINRIFHFGAHAGLLIYLYEITYIIAILTVYCHDEY
jgi:hypothetical protein